MVIYFYLCTISFILAPHALHSKSKNFGGGTILKLYKFNKEKTSTKRNLFVKVSKIRIIVLLNYQKFHIYIPTMQQSKSKNLRGVLF